MNVFLVNFLINIIIRIAHILTKLTKNTKWDDRAVQVIAKIFGVKLD